MLLLFVEKDCTAQPFQNEWINYSLTYQKFKIAQTGLYRINQSALASMGWGQVPVEQFVLWRNGAQVPLYTSSATGPLPPNGFIEFWAEANDGKPDQRLYRDADHQLNDTWSLYSDSASFFLTPDASVTPQRLQTTANLITPGLTPLSYFIYRTGSNYRDRINEGFAQIAGGYLHSSAFDQGEGWTSVDLGGGQTRTEQYSSLFAFSGAGAPAPTQREHVAGNAPNNLMVEIRAGGNLIQ
ncbi:MAG: hypothetical protein ACKOC7_04010, partial [Sphingomonadales bacterium]